MVGIGQIYLAYIVEMGPAVVSWIRMDNEAVTDNRAIILMAWRSSYT